MTQQMFDGRPQSAHARIRVFAIALAVAAALQPLLIAAMPAAIKPAMPNAVFVTVALLATLAARRPDAVDAAWRQSRLTRWMRS